MGSEEIHHVKGLVWLDGDLRAAGTSGAAIDARGKDTAEIALYSVDPGSSDKGWTVAVCTAEPQPSVRLRRMPIADLPSLVDELLRVAQRSHVAVALDAPLRAFGGVQAPSCFSPVGAIPGAAAWPFNVNPFAQRPCEKALCSRPPATAQLAASELRSALDDLCGDDSGLTLSARHPGVSVLGYMSAPHAPVVRAFLEALANAAEAYGVTLKSDPRSLEAGAARHHLV